MSHLDEKTLNVNYKHSSVVRKLVMLVLISINHLIPLNGEEEEEELPKMHIPKAVEKETVNVDSSEIEVENVANYLDADIEKADSP